MPRPTNPLTLVHSPSGEFPYDQWREHLRTYHYFRVVGFNHFRSINSLNDHSRVENEAILGRAKEIVKREWSSALPPASSSKDGIDLIGVNQIKRVRKHEPVSFQSACVAIVALELAIQGVGKNCDIYVSRDDDPHAVAICPTVFQVDQYDGGYYQTRIAERPQDFAALKKFTLQTQSWGLNAKENVFHDMSQGKLVTEWLADRFVQFWKSRPPSLSSISVCKPRVGNNFRPASNLEIQVFPLPASGASAP